MSDLKWITLGFIANLNLTVSRDEYLSQEERRLIQIKADELALKVKTASTDEEVEAIHICFHDLGNEVLKMRLRYYKSNKPK